MRISVTAEGFRESVGLAFDLVPRPLGDVLLGPLLGQTVIAASALGIFDALEDGPQNALEVAARCDSDPTATGKLLRALHGSKYLNYSGGNYRLTRMAERWLRSRSPQSIHSAILHRKLDFRFMDFERYVRSGEPKNFHDELGETDWICYHQGQASHARLIVKEVLDRSPLPARATRMLDLGGGHGLYSLAFCERYRNLRARVLDLATPLQQCPPTRGSAAVRERVQFEVADIRIAQLGVNSADVVLIANVLHHFDETTILSLFHRVARCLSPGGIMIALDLFRSDSSEKIGQVESLMNLYFGAASGTQLPALEDIRDWQQRSGLQPMRTVSLRLLPDCKLQAARKPQSSKGFSSELRSQHVLGH